jgi:hypothetical protein
MKPLLTGLTCLVASSILYGSTLIAASVYSRMLGEADGLGWDRRYGIYGTAMRDIGIVPIGLAVLLAVVGILLIIRSLKGDFERGQNEENA